MNLANLHLLLPEIFVLSMACVILLVDAYWRKCLHGIAYQLSQATLVGALLFTAFISVKEPVIALSGTFVWDSMAKVLKLFIYVITFTVFLYSRQYLIDRNLFKGEFFVLGLFAMAGMMVMVSAHHFLTLYLGLELLSLSLYAMVAMHRDSAQASEAAMKYFVLGALASGMLLYGMSIIYGLTGSLDLTTIAGVIAENKIEPMLLKFGLVFILIGLAFKLGAVPFHMWLPDVYQGAPTAVTLFISSAPKLAAFAMLMRLLVEGLGSLNVDWQGMLLFLSVLSMALGNIVAIAQTNVKRMLAYSTISHVGFLLLGMLTAKEAGYAAAMFYTMVYTLMSLGAFGLLLLLSHAGFEAENLNDFKGLNRRQPWYALIMMIVVLSMAGVPPMLGFWAKWSVLSQVVAGGFMWLAVLAVLFSVIGAFYYLRIIKLMYFDAPIDNAPVLKPSADIHWALTLNGMVILVLGVLPESLMTVCRIALS